VRTPAGWRIKTIRLEQGYTVPLQELIGRSNYLRGNRAENQRERNVDGPVAVRSRCPSDRKLDPPPDLLSSAAIETSNAAAEAAGFGGGEAHRAPGPARDGGVTNTGTMQSTFVGWRVAAASSATSGC